MECLLINEGFAFNQHLEDVIGGSEIQCHLIAKYLTGFGHEVFTLPLTQSKLITPPTITLFRLGS